MNIALGADHRGNAALAALSDHLAAQGHTITAVGQCKATNGCDYPEPAYNVAKAVSDGTAERGILLCGSGIGMCIAANKVKGVRAALVHDELTAQMSRAHNDANVLCLSADLLGQRLIEKIADLWLTQPFEGGRHARRVRKIHAIEEGNDPSSVAE